MARLRAEDLDRLGPLLAELRGVDALRERSPATFTRGSAAFLHFHSLADGLVADLKVGDGWRRYAADRASDRRVVLRDVRRVLRGDTADSPAGRPEASPPVRSGETHLEVTRMATTDTDLAALRLPNGYLPQFATVEEERRHRKERLAASFRLFGKFGFDEGVAGHITARDPEHLDHFWVNPFGMNFKHVRVSDLVRVNATGDVVEGERGVNAAAFAIHSQVHAARPDVIAAAHSHSLHGKAWSTLGRRLDPLTQDACAFYEDHAVFDDYTGVVLDLEEGKRIAHALGDGKAVILRNHGLLTVGHSVDEAVWWFITMERSCQAQLMAEAAGTPVHISPEAARLTASQVGSHVAGWFSFSPLYDSIVREQPDLLE